MIPTYMILLRITFILGLSLATSSLMKPDALHASFLVLPLLGFIAAGYLLLRAHSLNEHLSHWGEAQTAHLDKLPSKWIPALIVTAAGLSLFTELVIIRWYSSVYPLLAFYKNFSLLACFLGLGLGYAMASKKQIPLVMVVPVLLTQVIIFTIYNLRTWDDISLNSLFLSPMTEQVSLGLVQTSSAQVASIFITYTNLTVVFILTVLALVPIGQLCGRLMQRGERIPAYGFNLLGSLLGIGLILFMSSLWSPPLIWFLIVCAGLGIFLHFHKTIFSIHLLSSAVLLMIVGWPVSPGVEEIHSPYQVLEMRPTARGHSLISINAARHYHQDIYNFSEQWDAPEIPAYTSTRFFMNLPYLAYGKTPERVAVVGAGSGNDTAAALRSGAAQVDAIEIDPAIILLGKMYHPEKPYSQPRTTVYNEDARTFLRQTDKVYDLIVYGYLDSHTLLSHGTSVRLDSFVYTREGLTDARNHLQEHGLLTLGFANSSDEIGKKISLLIKQVFGEYPQCYQSKDGTLNLFVQNKQGNFTTPAELVNHPDITDKSEYYRNLDVHVDLPSDDWPFFYMTVREIPFSYLTLLAFILVLSLLFVGLFLRRSGLGKELPFFLLGVGFMLVETKAITELGLLYGNTWHVIGFVILGVLLMAFLANTLVYYFPIRKTWIPWVLLIMTIVGGYLLSVYGGSDRLPAEKITLLVILTVPIFFSGLLFSTLIPRAGSIHGAMAMNILGAMVGGALEYNSMLFGFSSLYLIALACYAPLGFYVLRGSS
jgi:hypothetical protein